VNGYQGPTTERLLVLDQLRSNTITHIVSTPRKKVGQRCHIEPCSCSVPFGPQRVEWVLACHFRLMHLFQASIASSLASEPVSSFFRA
jgi:hypothetical protein